MTTIETLRKMIARPAIATALADESPVCALFVGGDDEDDVAAATLLRSLPALLDAAEALAEVARWIGETADEDDDGANEVLDRARRALAALEVSDAR